VVCECLVNFIVYSVHCITDIDLDLVNLLGKASLGTVDIVLRRETSRLLRYGCRNELLKIVE
jgi:hypothetical protein